MLSPLTIDNVYCILDAVRRACGSLYCEQLWSYSIAHGQDHHCRQGIALLYITFAMELSTVLYTQPLLDAGASVNASDDHGNTPLHLMCMDPSALDCLTHLVMILIITYCISIIQVNHGALLDIENDKVIG